MRTPLKDIRGLGSAKDGTHHWWIQNLTAIALVPLVLWFVASIVCLVAGGATYEAARAWIGTPYVSILLILTITVMMYHSDIGLQVVVEDYVHGHGAKIALLIFIKFAHILLTTAGLFAVLRIAFTGGQ